MRDLTAIRLYFSQSAPITPTHFWHHYFLIPGNVVKRLPGNFFFHERS